MSERSVLLTGAPATGKTTMYRELLGKDFGASPPHMTRDKRDGETEGIDAFFVGRTDFEENLGDGFYFEKTVDQALYSANNQYYGCPEYWTDEINKGARLAIVPTSIFAARCLVRSLALTHEEVPIDWVHLHASEEQRARRMQGRGNVTDEEVNARLKKGDTHIVPPNRLARVVDTDGLRASEVLRTILRITDRRLINEQSR